MNPPRLILSALLAAVAFATAGCGTYYRSRERAHESSSVVSYLYPNQSNPLPPTSIPVLRIPLRVGILFVPSGEKNPRGGYFRPEGNFTEQQKTQLLERVAAQFRGRDFIEAIEIVPSSYLRPGGGFDNLNQVRSLLNIDVVALVAYDQVQFTSQNIFSFAYWTIVGAYVVNGNRNDTHTLMEAAVYDIPSRHLLFRAPGANQEQAGATAVNLPARLRENSAKSFEAATDDLIANLTVQLDSFRERAKQAPDTIARIERKPGYTGAGSSGAIFAVGCVALLGVRGLLRRRS